MRSEPLVPYFVRIPRSQAEFLKSLGRGHGAGFVRRAIAKQIEVAVQEKLHGKPTGPSGIIWPRIPAEPEVKLNWQA